MSTHYLYQPDPAIWTVPRENIVCGRCERTWVNRDKTSGYWVVRCDACGNMCSEEFWSKWGFYAKGTKEARLAAHGRQVVVPLEIVHVVPSHSAPPAPGPTNPTNEGEKKMAKKMCKTCGKTPAGTPDETCQKCYRAEHGVSYWSVKHPPSAKKDTAPAPKKEAIIKVPAQVVKKAVAEIPEEAFGKANGKPHTRITFVSVDVYGPSPIAELLRMFEAFNAR